MTVPNRQPAVPTHDVESAVDALREHGLRASSSRRHVLEALFLAGEPVSAEAIAGGLDGRLPPADLASVYRNLETLEQVGIVRHVHPGHGPGRYTVMGEAGLEFLACEHCGRLEAVASARLDGARALIERDLGFRPRFSHFPLVGTCAACSSARPGDGREAPRRARDAHT